MVFKIIVLVLFALSTAFKIFLYLLEYKSRNNKIPDVLSDVYDQDTYYKWKKYQAELVRSYIIFTLIGFVIDFTLLITNVYSIVANNVMDNVFVQVATVMGISIGIGFIIDGIREYVNTMIIEEKYGFNKTILKTFIADQIKSLLISSVLLIGLISLFGVIYDSMQDWVLLLFTGIAAILLLLFMFLYPKLSKINNKFTPLEDGSLKDKLTNLLTSHGYQVKAINVMDASKRTTKSNAYFAGYGKLKTIVLYDNLVNTMTEEEIVAVFAHELGHGLHKDTMKNSVISILNILLIVICAWLLVKFPNIYEGFGFNKINYAFSFLVLSTSFLPIIDPIISMISSYISRKNEYAADKQAVEEGYGEELISALKKLAKENFSNLSPDKLVVKLSYTHPTLEQRINYINSFLKEKKQ